MILKDGGMSFVRDREPCCLAAEYSIVRGRGDDELNGIVSRVDDTYLSDNHS